MPASLGRYLILDLHPGQTRLGESFQCFARSIKSGIRIHQRREYPPPPPRQPARAATSIRDSNPISGTPAAALERPAPLTYTASKPVCSINRAVAALNAPGMATTSPVHQLPQPGRHQSGFAFQVWLHFTTDNKNKSSIFGSLSRRQTVSASDAARSRPSTASAIE